ncbi:hypothetical protein [Leifsonia kafniensis]
MNRYGKELVSRSNTPDPGAPITKGSAPASASGATSAAGASRAHPTGAAPREFASPRLRAASEHPRRTVEALIFSRDVTSVFGSGVRLSRLVKSGELTCLTRGQYIRTHQWAAMGADQRYAARVLAAAHSRIAPPPLSHYSAAVLWGLPMLRTWPSDVHFLSERKPGGQSYPGIRIHAVGFDARDVTMLDGVHVTTVARTVVDLAACLDVKSAVAVIDRALAVDRFNNSPPLTTKQELRDTWERMLPFSGSVRAREYIEFGTEDSGSPGESSSRVNIALNGFPTPILQRTFVIDGKEYHTDFFWEEIDGVGESDGDIKYFDPAMLGDRTPEQVLKAERNRERAIRRKVHEFTRWDFAVGQSQYRLRERLMEIGLVPGRPRLQLKQFRT